ncbi:hypothetical protein E3T55_08325 [Cryobacterium frigoriphilum]|uniref:Cell wall-binding repeat-containing protein n=1 Tax=Cryobacterium frigoriphilum TaxID=1259150 RepID=A0A4R9A2I4_9MICO|nr:cell wall-binding repeat-containing protein [Cryobacterium frigoriphilum]TFD50794.1 hypothetical protein E3T55_08325 [Cryobacterium frigoriphilum]
MNLLLRTVSLVVALIVMIGTLVAVDTASNSPAAQAASGEGFNAGNIISDSIFYNSGTMSAADIQSFLNSKVANCASGYTCLKDYRADSTSQPARAAGCAAFAGRSGLSAAQIISEVSTACSINPQTLLVLLEKEQGLVTRTSPTDGIYRKATGYGCPDTAVCDSVYYGFFNQVYNAAFQFKKYQASPGGRGYQAGRTNTIQWHPNAGCGSSQVYIQNQATAGLYLYTPYRPNQAALNNMYGSGDGCSSYGNRNFYRIFTDWFGATQGVAPHGEMVALYNTGALGLAVTGPFVSSIGVEQLFQSGWAYWSESSGAFLVAGAIGNTYRDKSGTSGGLGFPVAAERSEANGGASQRFQRGWLYWSDRTGTHQTSGAIADKYLASAGPAGGLGYPMTDETALAGGGSSQQFEGAYIYWSEATGNQSVSGALASRLIDIGGPGSGIGHPVADESAAANGGTRQLFQNGSLYWSGGTGAFEVLSPLDASYQQSGGPGGALGYPTSGTRVFAEQEFEQAFTGGLRQWSVANGFLAVPAVTQVGGADRYATAVAISREGFATTASTVYIATGADFPDALGAAPAAAKQGAPLLLVETNALPSAVAAEISRLKPARIVVVGGESVVSAAVANQLRTLSPRVDRLAGIDRFETARKVIADAFPNGAAHAYVATGWDYPDALTAAAAAGAKGVPVVLVDGRAATAGTATTQLLNTLKVTKATIVGASAVVSDGLATSITTSSRSVERLGGVDRFATAQLVNESGFQSSARVFYATAYEFPDALAGAALAGAKKSPLYVVEAGCVPGDALWDLDRLGTQTVTLLGGTGALGASVKSLRRC